LAWRFAGLIAFADPVRRTVPAAIAACREAGIRVVMITGDHPATAKAIAEAAGIDCAHVSTGSEVAAMNAQQLASLSARVSVFARVRPEQKLRLVRSLRGAGEVVAMTGDGVNDAPALKAADIGIAMGARGTDVAREAAALVLLQDDFTAIVGTVRLGRRIYENIRNAMQYLVAVHVPLAAMALLPLLVGLPPLLFPLHVVFLEFVIDPACTLVFENEHGDDTLMRRPPRDPDAPLLGAAAIFHSTALGAFALVVVAAVYAGAFAFGHAAEEARALGFTALVCSNVALIVAFRSRRLTLVQLFGRRNDVSWIVIAAALCALLAVVYLPAAAELLRMTAPSWTAQAIAAIAGLSVLAVSDFPKRLRQSREPR
jgi:Ca2+-transporting ATPase